jgi:hypothetical protein
MSKKRKMMHSKHSQIQITSGNGKKLLIACDYKARITGLADQKKMNAAYKAEKSKTRAKLVTIKRKVYFD